MDAHRTAGWAIAAVTLLLVTGCAQPSGAGGTPPAGAAPTPAGSASAGAPGQQTPGALQTMTVPLGSAGAGVTAKLPINGYAALPGQEITFDASGSEGSIDKYEWDLDGDGTFDRTTTSPVLKYTYDAPFDGQMVLRVSSPLGTTDTLRTPVRIGAADPAKAPLAPPTNVEAAAVSADGTEVKVTWDSDDPRADSWGIAVNGVPVGRVERAARSITVTDVRREKDVLLQVFAIGADGQMGVRAGTTLPAK